MFESTHLEATEVLVLQSVTILLLTILIMILYNTVVLWAIELLFNLSISHDVDLPVHGSPISLISFFLHVIQSLLCTSPA